MNKKFSNKKTRKEKIELLDNAVRTLKQEFVGLDSIIDQIKESITPWYITPEIILRPIIISLWGMTGTGKSSVVRRLIELLDLKDITMYFDCGKEISNDRIDSIPDKTRDILGLGEDSDDDGITDLSERKFSPIYIFDEFQYARTIDSDNKEVSKPSLRPIWNIIDSGRIDIGSRYDYDWNTILSYISDLVPIVKRYPGIKVEKNYIVDPNYVKIILEEIGPFWFGHREIPGLINGDDKADETDIPFYNNGADSNKAEEEEENKTGSKDPYRPLKILNNNKLRKITKKLNKINYGLGKEFLKDINSCTTLDEVIDLLNRTTKKISSSSEVNVTGSLVFIIGNLDEAFKVQGDINPDIDADIFYNMTSKVTVLDIKNSLKNRFRAEQIARIGNNLIKYPTLKKESFEKIIKTETDKIIARFNKIDSIKVTVDPEIYNLLYCEGVFPVQGVRPVFTTIETIFTPLFSKILLQKKDTDKSVRLGILDKSDSDKGFKTSETIITLSFDSDNRVYKYPYHLELGESRNPEKRKTRYINSVHEAGHAIVYSMCTGNLPDNIVSVSTDHGGFCTTYNEDRDSEISTRQDIDNSVMIGLAGYEAEMMIFGDRPEMCLLGSGNDIESVYSDFSNAVYNLGYFEPFSISDREVENSTFAISSGLNSEEKYVYYYDGVEFTKRKMELQEAIEKRLQDLRENTQDILRKEQNLLKHMAIYLGEHGSMNSEKMLEFIEKYSTGIDKKKLENIKKTYGYSWYKKILEK